MGVPFLHELASIWQTQREPQISGSPEGKALKQLSVSDITDGLYRILERVERKNATVPTELLDISRADLTLARVTLLNYRNRHGIDPSYKNLVVLKQIEPFGKTLKVRCLVPLYHETLLIDVSLGYDLRNKTPFLQQLNELKLV